MYAVDLVNRINSFYDEVTLVVVSNECSGNILFLCFYVAKLAPPPQGAYSSLEINDSS